MSEPLIGIQDPVHGTIELTPAEMKLVDTRPFQRLRFIKQLGFAEFAFPGATHSRYAHSLGAMHMASRMFDRVASSLPVTLTAPHKARLRQAVRLAVLFHDLGHPPLSHASERVMPALGSLGHERLLPADEDGGRQATHEDYTLLLLEQGELAERLTSLFSPEGVDACLLASLICGRRVGETDDAFRSGGIDLLPLLSQIVSSELDADRMDYLRRDAFFCGVSYGNFDHNWLCQNLLAVPHEDDGLVLGLRHKGVWAFENFLLARYHMFLAVYYHHTSTCFETMLARFYQAGEYSLGASVDAYLAADDVQLHTALRASSNAWAKGIVSRKPWRLILESHHFAGGDSLSGGKADVEDSALDGALVAANIAYFRTRNRSMLSKYYPSHGTLHPLLVVESPRRAPKRIDAYTPLYRRFGEATGVSRIFCEPKDFARAQAVVQSIRATA